MCKFQSVICQCIVQPCHRTGFLMFNCALHVTLIYFLYVLYIMLCSINECALKLYSKMVDFCALTGSKPFHYLCRESENGTFWCFQSHYCMRVYVKPKPLSRLSVNTVVPNALFFNYYGGPQQCDITIYLALWWYFGNKCKKF